MALRDQRLACAYAPTRAQRCDAGPRAPAEAQPDGTYAFDAEHARLRVAVDGTLLLFEELNDLFGTWVHFMPDA